MTYGSICSGIEAATVAWRPLGWSAAFFAEIDPFCCKLLKHYYPEVPNRGDFTKIRESEPIDVLVGGTPCQSFSVAGKRRGLDDPRGNLTLEYLALARRLRPRWLVWENVPGVLSDDGGRTFGAVLGTLADLGYGFAYRVFDAQFFGLAQRRERVFVVGSARGWAAAAAVFLERESLSGHPAPRREAGEGTACDVVPSLTGSGRGVERTGESRGQDPVVAMCLNAHPSRRIDAESETFESAWIGSFIGGGGKLSDVSPCLQSSGGQDERGVRNPIIAHSLRAEGFDASEDGTGRGVPLVPISFKGNMSTPSWGCDISETLQAENFSAVAFHENQRGELSTSDTAGSLNVVGGNPGQGYSEVAFTERTRSDGTNLEFQEDLAYALTNPGSGVRTHSRQIQAGMSVRRLTPRECERLQGFPDDYTMIPEHRKASKERGADADELLAYYHRTERGREYAEMRGGKVYATPDGPRYRALGNSMPVPVMRWIGERIAEVDRICCS